jgi:hypothetical protein
MLTIVKHLSGQSAPAHWHRALDTVEQELQQAKKDAFDHVSHTFPGFQDAMCYLEEVISAGKLTTKAPPGSGNYWSMTPEQRELDRQREEYIDRFVQHASHGGDVYGYGYGRSVDDDFGDPMDGVDSGDSDYEEQRNARCPNLGGGIAGWIVVLQEWPDKKTAKEVWDRVKESESKNLLFRVDGIAEGLASRCALFPSSR